MTTEADGNESLSTAGPVSASDNGFRLVEDKFRELEWNNPLSEPSISVELAEGRSLTIRLSNDSTHDRSELIAVHREPGPQHGNTTTTTLRRSRPLKDAQQALALLRAYTQDNGEFKSLVEWVEKDDSASAKGE